MPYNSGYAAQEMFGLPIPYRVDRFSTENKGELTKWNQDKKAMLETGTEVKVPLFIDEGDVLKIDTRTGEYVSRA